MKILIIGSGGREHAIGKKLLEDDKNIILYFYPGNGGTSLIGKNIEKNYTILELALFAKKNNISITIVGSEIFLSKKIVDVFHFYNLCIIGPDFISSKLEVNRIFAKNFMKKYNIPNPRYKVFCSYKEAINFIEKKKNIGSLAIKPNGIALGKGVIITNNKSEAKNAIKTIMVDKKFGDSGNKILIEEFINGIEISIMSIFNKKNIIPFLSSKDYKKSGENDNGLNTGGMGTVTPNPYMTDSIYKYFKKNILEATLTGLLSEKLTFVGFLYFGLIVPFNSQDKVYLLEYNTRMGDPETQSLMPLMKTSFLKLLTTSLLNKNFNILWDNKFSCCVILSSKGYPEEYKTGKIITGLNLIKDPWYVSGASIKNKQWVTTSGRVLNIVGLDKDIKNARKIAYEKINKIHFDNIYFRNDIGSF